MSSDHYAQHLIQKYRLAVAIGIIQTKPEAKTLDQHITDLIIKINDDKMEDFAICSDDFDMEFNDMTDFDDQLETSQHSETILKDFNDVQLSGNDEFGHKSRQNILADLTEDDEGSHVQVQNDENDIKSTFCETRAQSDAHLARESLTDIDKTFCDSIALINRDEIIAIDEACNSVTKTYKTKTAIDKATCKNKTYCGSIVKINQNENANAKNTFCENITNTNVYKRQQHKKENANMDKDKQYLYQTTAFDSQATELYTLHTLTEDYTHVSQSQTNNFDVSNRYIKGIKKINDNQDTRNNVEDSLSMHGNYSEFGNNIKDVNLVNNINRNLGKVTDTEQGEIDDLVQITQTTIGVLDFNNKNKNSETNTEFCYNFKDINLVNKINNKLNENNLATALIKQNVPQNTQTATNVHNSQNIEENKHNTEENSTNTEFEYSFKDINLARKVSNNIDRQDNFINIAMELEVDNFDLNTQANLNPRDFSGNNDYTQETQVQCTGENSKQTILNQFETNISRKTTSVHEISRTNNESMTMQVFNCSQNDQDVFYNNEINKITKPINTVKDISKTNAHNSEYTTMQVFDLSLNDKLVENNKMTSLEISKENTQNTETINTQVFDINEKSQNPVDSKITETDLENESVSSEEVSELVPFKVMEELNRVKAFLYRRIERRISIDSTLDSGYRSDSQGRSKSALQMSGNWVGQSAYCLYEHIARCPMVATTQDIIKEISQTLGQLIDRLHEEESYPAFLEELLDYVDTLIRSIFTDEDMLLEKDEKIQRLFLLNKSIHIQKYSIEKLTDILENIQASLTANEELHELTNTQEVENLSYIFHILEVIIKNYLKNKKNYDIQAQSQDTELYQKKTTISDIWRKKWNPNYKEESKLDCGLDKKCVFTKCSEVLNKIVVGCLDGYSLVAYAALQCFNLLQS